MTTVDAPADNALTEEATPGQIVLNLSTPIRAFDEPVDRLKMREPTGKDMIMVGNPVLMNVYSEDPASTIKFDYPVLAKMIARLASVPESAVEMMRTTDLTAAGWRLAPFFMPVS